MKAVGWDAQSAAPAVLFDVDGTLVDTNYFHAVAWFRAFRQVGAQVAMADVHRHIGMGGERLVNALMPERDAAVDHALHSGHAEHYASYFGIMQPFPQARELLRELAGRGAKVVLATSANPRELAALRAALDVEDALATVTSSADAASSKPDPDILQAALQQSGVDASRSIMVGDTVWDVEAAARAGLPCIGVLTGGICGSELTAAGAVAIYDDVAALLAGLAASPIGALLAAAGLAASGDASGDSGGPGRL
jgi:HAD superfamily hydrolase (TIGR01509 family)